MYGVGNRESGIGKLGNWGIRELGTGDWGLENR